MGAGRNSRARFFSEIMFRCGIRSRALSRESPAPGAASAQPRPTRDFRAIVLIASITMFTAAPPMISSGWRTVVSEGAESAGDGHIIKADHRALLRHADAGLGQRANRSHRGQIVKRQQCREFFLFLQQLLGQAVAMIEAGVGVEYLRQLHHQRRIDFQFHRLREFLNAAPPRGAVNQALWPANAGDAPVAQLVRDVRATGGRRLRCPPSRSSRGFQEFPSRG